MADAFTPLVRRPGPEEPDGLFGLPRVLSVPFEATGGALGVWQKMVAKGIGPSLHRHVGEYEILIVIDGSVSVRCGETRVEADKGTVVVIPPGAPHAYEGTREACPSCILLVMAPCLGVNVTPLARRGGTGGDYSMELVPDDEGPRAANDDGIT